MKTSILGAAMLLGTVGAASAWTPPPDVPSEYAVTYQMNVGHSGSVVLGEPFAPPFKKLWKKPFIQAAGYPLIAEGNAYVLVGGVDLLAIKLDTGRQAWEHLLSTWGNLGAYDAGQLFFVNSGGTMIALTAKTGKLNWTTPLLRQNTFTSPPTAQNGMVYVGGAGHGGLVYGVDQVKGKVQWIAEVENGDNSSPALGDDGVYVDYPCQFYKFNSTTGAPLWHVSNGCDGGGGWTPAFFGNEVYMRDLNGHYVFNAHTGHVDGSFSGDLMPTVFQSGAGSYSLTVLNKSSTATVYCTDLSTGNIAWKFDTASTMSAPPVYANGYALVGDNVGNVTALDSSGVSRWSTQLSLPISSIAIGQGAFVVVASDIWTSEVAAFAPQ